MTRKRDRRIEMLILERDINEKVYIYVPPGKGFRVAVQFFGYSKGGKIVKLGFEAPKHVVILRGELTDTRDRPTLATDRPDDNLGDMPTS